MQEKGYFVIKNSFWVLEWKLFIKFVILSTENHYFAFWLSNGGSLQLLLSIFNVSFESVTNQIADIETFMNIFLRNISNNNLPSDYTDVSLPKNSKKLSHSSNGISNANDSAEFVANRIWK